MSRMVSTFTKLVKEGPDEKMGREKFYLFNIRYRYNKIYVSIDEI